MKNKSFNITFIIIIVATISIVSSEKKKNIFVSNLYFPVNNGVTLIYKSSFGESSSKCYQEGDFTISLSKGDDFQYKQTLMIKDDGVYSIETYQYYKILLFFSKEATVTYNKPLLRFPLPLLPGAEWEWEGKEFSNDESNKVKVSGKALCKEFVFTEAGKFEAIKIETIVESASGAKNIVTEWYSEGLGLIKVIILIDGGGVMGLLRDLLGYKTIEFELNEIKRE